MVDVAGVAVEHDDRSIEYRFSDCSAEKEGGEGLTVGRRYAQRFVVLDIELLRRWAASFGSGARWNRAWVDEFTV